MRIGIITYKLSSYIKNNPKMTSIDIKSILCKLNRLLIFYTNRSITAYTGITDLRLDISLCNQLNEHKFHGDVTILDLLRVQSYGVVS